MRYDIGLSHNGDVQRHGFLPMTESDTVLPLGDDESICQREMTEGYHVMLEEVGACYGSCQGILTEVGGKKSACQ